jgi:carboxymethylenebutenolidase
LARRFVREVALCLLLGLIAVAPYRVLAAEGQKVSFKSGNDTVSGLLYTPTGSGKHPAIVVIHEWWGLNDWIKQQAEELSKHGYVTLAVDLYRGQVATDPEMAHELMRGLPQDQGVRDLTAAAAYLRSRKDVDASRIGAIGWCMGGGYAAQLAVADPKLKAVSINYGALPTDPAALAAIHAAVLGNFGGQDRGIPPASVEAFSAALKKMGKPVDVKIYPDAGHAFENPNNKTGYRKQDAEDAEQRSVNFFATTLGGTGQ